MTKVCSFFKPSNEPPFDVARHWVHSILPDDRLWVVNFSVRDGMFRCIAQVETLELQESDPDSEGLGLVLTLAITKDNELYAKSLAPSRTNSDKRWNGAKYKKWSEIIFPKFQKSWRVQLQQGGIRVEF